MSEVRSWTDPGPPPVEVVAASDYRDALERIELLRGQLRGRPIRSQSALELLEAHAEALEAENERLKGQLFAAQQAILTEGLTADRLRAALEKIAHDEKAAHQAWVSRSEETARDALRGADEIHPRERDNRAVSTEGCRSAATVSGTPESYSCSDPRQDARTPAGDGAASPVLHADETSPLRINCPHLLIENWGTPQARCPQCGASANGSGCI